MDNNGEEAGLCGLAGLTGAVQGVFARSWHGGYPQISLAWSFSISTVAQGSMSPCSYCH